MTAGLAIFVKTPGHSPVKTRLAADCGRACAVAWYLHAAAAVASVTRVALAMHDLVPYWAVAEPDAVGHGAWRDLPVLAQGEGGLGDRMARVHATLVAKHGAGVLIGADAPQLSAGMLGEAVAWLRQPGPRLSLGPARDGGFWLFGANVAPPLEAWQRVRYSVPETARELRAAMAECGRWQTLPELTDVDRGSDLAATLQELEQLRVREPEQQRLIEWMRATFPQLATSGPSDNLWQPDRHGSGELDARGLS